MEHFLSKSVGHDGIMLSWAGAVMITRVLAVALGELSRARDVPTKLGWRSHGGTRTWALLFSLGISLC